MEQAIQDYTNMIMLCFSLMFIILVTAILLTFIFQFKKRKISCSKCLHKIDRDSIFCKYCGDKIFKK